MDRHPSLLLLWLLGLCIGCGGGGHFVVVTVSGIPEEAAFLDERTGVPVLWEAPDVHSFDLGSVQPENPGAFSFVLDLEPLQGPQAQPGFAGWGQNLEVSTAAFDRAGCLIGLGQNFLDLPDLMNDVSTVTLGVPLQTFPAPDCTGTRNLVLHAVVAATGDCVSAILDGPTLMEISGWGIAQHAQVALNGQSVDSTFTAFWCSTSSYLVDTSSASAPAQGQLSVENPDGQTAVLANVSL